MAGSNPSPGELIVNQNEHDSVSYLKSIELLKSVLLDCSCSVFDEILNLDVYLLQSVSNLNFCCCNNTIPDSRFVVVNVLLYF